MIDRNLEDRPYPGQPGYIEWRSNKIVMQVKALLEEMAELHPGFRYNISKVRVSKANKPELPHIPGQS